MSKRVGNQFAVYNSGGVSLSDGDETGFFVDGGGNLLVNSNTTLVSGLDSGLANTLSTYRSSLTSPLKLQLAYQDDFNKGFQGWQYQHDSSSNPKAGLTLTTESRMGNYALELHSPKVASGACWARKGLTLPANLKKIIFGCYFSFHAINGNNPGVVAFDCDTQFGDGSATGNQRYFFVCRYVNHDGTNLLQKWQVNTGTSSQSFTDVPGGAMPIPFNESMKPMPTYMMMVLDYENRKYEKLYAGGNQYDISALAPAASLSLTNPFDMGIVNIVRVEGRANSSEEGIMTIERPFLIWGF